MQWTDPAEDVASAKELDVLSALTDLVVKNDEYPLSHGLVDCIKRFLQNTTDDTQLTLGCDVAETIRINSLLARANESFADFERKLKDK
jgi:hypothetical protein